MLALRLLLGHNTLAGLRFPSWLPWPAPPVHLQMRSAQRWPPARPRLPVTGRLLLEILHFGDLGANTPAPNHEKRV